MKNHASAVLFAIVLTAVLTAAAWGQSSKAVPSTTPVQCIAIVSPALEGVPGNALEAAAGIRDVIASYLAGPSVKVVVLEAKLPSQAREEAKQKGCEPLLFTKVT